MKKIAFFMSSMQVAGIEKSVLRLINRTLELDHSIKVSLFLINKSGPLINELNPKCEVNSIDLNEGESELLLLGGFRSSCIYYLKKFKLLKIIAICYRRLIKHNLNWAMVNWSKIQTIEEIFDYAICCTSHMPFLVKFVDEKVLANKKYLFIHSDFDKTKYKIKYLSKHIYKYSDYCCVSQSLLDQFISIFPDLSKNSQVVHNYFPIKQVINLSECKADYPTILNPNSINILTVGNFTPEKGHKFAFKCIEQLEKMNQFEYTWTFIGSGNKSSHYKKRIYRKGIQNKVRILCDINNPYPFFKKCDLYIQTSKTEGYCTTVLEAKAFKKPIICTDVPGTHELLDDYDIGYILKSNKASEVINLIKSQQTDNKKVSFSLDNYNSEIDEKIKILFSIK